MSNTPGMGQVGMSGYVTFEKRDWRSKGVGGQSKISLSTKNVVVSGFDNE